MRFLLLLLSLVLQLNISGFANHNPQENHAIKTHTSPKYRLSVIFHRNGEYKVDCLFRFQGQYEDAETGLYYNRFRYYDPSSGSYISQDPIRLAGNNPTLYGYVKDPNSWIDVFGLDCRTKNSPLRRDKHGNPIPDPEAKGFPHTQLGEKEGRNGTYKQAREFDSNGKPVRDIDFTDHGRPKEHPNPHQHRYYENATGGTRSRGKTAEPLN